MLKAVIDTNLWIRVLLGGRTVQFILSAWQQRSIEIVVSRELLGELDEVWQRPRLQKRISAIDAQDLLDQLSERAIFADLKTIPPFCRDPKDDPVLATAIDGNAEVVVSSDGDVRADDALRQAMLGYGVKLWGITALRDWLASQP